MKVAIRVSDQFNCAFCGGKCFYRYSMGEYDIWQCRDCRTGCVWPVPAPRVLKEYYDGFSSHFGADWMPVVEASSKELFAHLQLCAGRNLKMLDIGGGGGFFSKAFEDLGYGESTYVDLDPQSCDFAGNTLGLERVFNCDAMDIGEYAGGNFDFIYCRHVIEHLPDPITFMERILGYLKDDGIFVVQVPNGDSLEYLAYPQQSTIRRRVSVICRTNDLSLLRVFWVMISGGMLHGIDPPRHLWAITREGMKRWADGKGINCDIHTHHLGDPAYSPYYKRRKNIIFRVLDFVGQKLLGPIHGGTHLVAVLRRVDGGGRSEP